MISRCMQKILLKSHKNKKNDKEKKKNTTGEKKLSYRNSSLNVNV